MEYRWRARGTRKQTTLSSTDMTRANRKKYITYLDANNLYGWAMSKPLPIRDWRQWRQHLPTEEEIIDKKENAKRWWILEVDQLKKGFSSAEREWNP